LGVSITYGVESIAATKPAHFTEEKTDDGVEVAVSRVPEYPANAQLEGFWILWDRLE
jgi:hypothetical protein